MRHGETDWNKKDITQGQSESLLSDVGINQVKDTAQKLKSVKFDAIFSSDLLRAYQTAEIMSVDRLLRIYKSPLLRERSYGIFEGHPSSLFKDAFKDKLKEKEALLGDEYLSFQITPFIETDEKVVMRIENKLIKITEKFLNKCVLVVTHGGCIKNFLVKIGYTQGRPLLEGTFEHGGFVKIKTNGTNYKVEEIVGIKSIK